ncbi:MAG: N-6 DNA methylase, partial [Anaerolineae bacterium]|nr:N-6 DNA methylase [Anaerolineae bacterium]
MTSPFETYIAKIEKDLRGGKATEHTYRSSLEELMESLGRSISASNDPKHIACGAPDFIVEKGKVPLGYVETKDVGESLDKIEKTDQMKRYLKALNNLILTDYLEFRWYVNGERKRVVRAAEVGKNKGLLLQENADANIMQLFSDFYATETPTVATPKELASRLASVTHFIRDQIIAALESNDERLQKALEERFNTFHELLLPALKPNEFADLYAQAMTYGLFAAKLSAPEDEKFTLRTAYQFLFGNKFLRRLFADVSEELDEIEIIRPYLLDIVSLLNRADFHSILTDFGRRTRTEDPVVHFYETFLAKYDPKLRESRGVFYTPEPAVQFIVNAVDYLLKTRFNRPWGLADSSVKVLDPATGTGTFLFYVILKIYEEVVTRRKQAGQWKQKSKELLSRVFGFELLIAPYVVSHLKLALLLKELGAPLEGRDERLQVYLTNTLEEGVTRAEQLAGLGHYIAEEASDAAFVKKNQQIMVVLGNPPYSGHSANTSVDKEGNPNFIGKLLREYYFVDGAPLGERNPKWLQDDYVKFIRFGEWRIDKTGHGILAFITNHGYLDNPTFRGMRQHLMNTFDELYVLDLHGNSKKKETTPDGGKDENVFDIQQGVAIILAVKHAKKTSEVFAEHPRNGKEGAETLEVWHASLWGRREEKYAALRDSNLNDIEWQELRPDKPFYLFSPQDIDLRNEYEQGWKISEAMPVNTPGIVTARDDLTIHLTKSELLKTINEFISLPPDSARGKFNLGADVRDWKVAWAQEDIRSSGVKSEKIEQILYRPFDTRVTYYTGRTRGFICMPRTETMRNMLAGENLGLLTTRTATQVWDTFITNIICGHKSCAAYDINFLFPLYLFTTPEETAGTLFAQSEVTRTPNLAPAFLSAFSEKLGLQFILDGSGDLKKTFGPEDVFYYAYAVFHSPTYRTRYAEFLKIDFPRLPLTSNRELFAQL